MPKKWSWLIIAAGAVSLIGTAHAISIGEEIALSSQFMAQARQQYEFIEIPGYLSTHPPTVERLMHIADVLEDAALPRSDGPVVASTGAEFKRVRARLMAVYEPVDRSLAFFAHALKDDPGDSLAHWGCGHVLIRDGRYDDAIAHLTLATHPPDPWIRADLGKAYYLSGQYQKALMALAPVSENAWVDADGLYFLGCSQMKTGRLSAASDTMESLLKTHPDHADAYRVLGEIRHLQGLAGEAHYYLGVYFKETMQTRPARFHLEKALALMTDPSAEKRVRRVLAELGPVGRKSAPGHEKPSAGGGLT